MSRSDKAARRIRFHGTWDGLIQLDETASRKLLRVLRLKQGDTFTAIDDAGNACACSIAGVDGNLVVATVNFPIERFVETSPIDVALAVIKGNRMDWAVEKLAELGARSIIPLVTDRAVVRKVGDEKLSRWRKICESAALQSGHSMTTDVADPMVGIESFADARGSIWYLHRDGDSSDNPRFSRDNPTPWTLLVGPEGGWSDRELELLTGRTEKPSFLSRPIKIFLGFSTFRAETAALLGIFTMSCQLNNTFR